METTPNDFRNNLGDIKESVKKNVKQELHKRGWDDRYHAVQDKARVAIDTSEEFVKTHPYYTILGAAAVGFVAGMLIRRNH